VPDKAALYFNKIQCFCFEEQRLRPGEAVDMPVFFYIDPELADDFNCRWAGPRRRAHRAMWCAPRRAAPRRAAPRCAIKCGLGRA
jgi:hypothetical protein